MIYFIVFSIYQSMKNVSLFVRVRPMKYFVYVIKGK